MIQGKIVNVEAISAAMAALSPESVEGILGDVAASARNHWIMLAGANLHSMKTEYINGIQEVETSPGMATITLLGVLPNMLENGMSEVDMHDTLLGPNVPVLHKGQVGRGKREKKDGSGYYRAIPFRHAAPTSKGLTGAPMGSQFEGVVADAKKLGKDVYNAAKKLAPTTGDPYSKTKWGGRLPGGMAPKLKAEHHSDIFAGMVKQTKTYAKATQSTYMTFRMISTGSPGWIRPATPGLNLAEEVAQFASALLPAAVDAYFKAGSGTP